MAREPATPTPDTEADDTFDPTAEEAARVASHLNEATEGEAEPEQQRQDQRGEGDDRFEVRGPHDDKRARIAANYRDRTRAENRQSMEQIDPNDANLNYGAHAVEGTLQGDDLDDQEREALRLSGQVEGEEGRQQSEEGAEGQPEYDENDPNVEVLINGERRIVRQSDLISNFQKNSAADEKFRQASELVRAAAALAASRQPTPVAEQRTEPAPPAAAPTGPPSFSDEDMAKLVEQVQFGDSADAAKALRAAIEGVAAARAQPQPTAPVDIRSQVRFTLEDQRSEEALKQFVEDNPEIADDPSLQRVTADFSHAEMLQDLRNAGIPDDWLMSNIVNTENPAYRLMLAHKTARVEGWPNIRAPAEILPAAMAAARERASRWAGGNSGSPVPANGSDRLERKRISVQTQPAQRGAAPRPPSSPERSHSDTIAKMRQARHQAV